MTVREFISWQIDQARKYGLEDHARRAAVNASDAYVAGVITRAECESLQEHAGRVLSYIGCKEPEQAQKGAVK